MSTPLPDFKPGTRIIGQASGAGPIPSPGVILSKGAAAGQQNIVISLATTVANTFVANAAFVDDNGSLPTTGAAFKINYVNP